jgi:hypothetical protein
MEASRFPIRVDGRFRWPLLLFGVTPQRAFVDVSSIIDARFGWFSLRVPLADIVGWRIEGPFRWITAIGVRRSVRGGDVTFGGSAHGGVRIDFRERVHRGPFRIPALYVSADDLEGLAADLARRGIPGLDARRPAGTPPEPGAPPG